MKKLSVVVVTILTTILVSLPVFAGDVTVKWQDPENYTDIRSGDQDKDEFRATLFKTFDHIFADLAKKLPDNTHWQVTVTDLDLAGEVKPFPTISGREQRVIKRNDRPAITFISKLMDANNKVISEQKVDLIDFGFMSKGELKVGNDRKLFPYEEAMIKHWFDQQQSNKLLPSK